MTTNRDPIAEAERQDHLARMEDMRLGTGPYRGRDFPPSGDKPACIKCGGERMTVDPFCDKCDTSGLIHTACVKVADEALYRTGGTIYTPANIKLLAEAVQACIETEIARLKGATT